jgi:hypothetical protein
VLVRSVREAGAREVEKIVIESCLTRDGDESNPKESSTAIDVTSKITPTSTLFRNSS